MTKLHRCRPESQLHRGKLTFDERVVLHRAGHGAGVAARTRLSPLTHPPAPANANWSLDISLFTFAVLIYNFVVQRHVMKHNLPQPSTLNQSGSGAGAAARARVAALANLTAPARPGARACISVHLFLRY